MYNLPAEVPAAARAKWLAEVAETLEQAQGLLNRLKIGGLDPAKAAEVTVRIEAAKHEVQSLRARPRAENEPRWTNLPPWDEGERSYVP